MGAQRMDKRGYPGVLTSILSPEMCELKMAEMQRGAQTGRLRPLWPLLPWGALIGKGRGWVAEKHAATEELYEPSRPIRVHQEPFIPWCASFPPPDSPEWRGPSRWYPLPFQPLAPSPRQPGESGSFLRSPVGSQVSPLSGARVGEQSDVSRQATLECLSEENPKWPPRQGNEWEA